MRIATLGVLGALPAARQPARMAQVLAQLEHPEPGVRAAAVDALGALQASLPTLVVPESAVVVTAVLGERGQARGIMSPAAYAPCIRAMHTRHACATPTPPQLTHTPCARQARGVFCYVDERLGPDAPPFAFVPAAEEVWRLTSAYLVCCGMHMLIVITPSSRPL